MLKVKQIEGQTIYNNSKDKQEKFASKIKFLSLVLCEKKTIRASAQICKINFSTAKAILNTFRRQGVIRNHQQDYDSQVNLLKQIVQIQKGIKIQEISKNQEIKQKLNNKLKGILLNIQNSKKNSQFHVQNQMNINALQEQYSQEKQKEYILVKQILEQQIILMKKISH
ncbi:unnamed protein product [Paramecium sonneborni]|uniref:Uncharacterized protein n=1 Tax=Paramecium sonneborni TaxID=65129 RepID=A0A8S1M1X1_9CILI|nr:unnamed protein product [Paramecium sonneborni]